jgi:type 1 glutamine amidotransferase
MTDFPEPIRCALIVGGKYHDMDFARIELLKLLAEDGRVLVDLHPDYARIDQILAADFLITYTCDVVPDLDGQEKLRRWVGAGGRWYALHGTNSVLRFIEDGRVDTPDLAPHFMETLGTSFASHPPIESYRVYPTEAGQNHPLTHDIDAFDTIDEQYLSVVTAPIDTLLATRFAGTTDRFVKGEWTDAEHPVLYLRRIGSGAILYLTLGHCRNHYNLRPMVAFYPKIERCSWELPIFYELLRRGIAWAKEETTMADKSDETLAI